MITTNDFANDNKFKLGEIVYHQDQKYWVTGIQLYLGYDLHLWTYCLSKPTYGENVAPWQTSRCNIDQVKDVKEPYIQNAEEYNNKKMSDLQKQIEKTQKELDELMKQKNSI